MLKRNLESLDTSKLINGGGDDLTLFLAIKSAFDEVIENNEMLYKMIKRVGRSNNLRFVVAAGAIYYIYKTFDERLKALEKTEEKEETAE